MPDESTTPDLVEFFCRRLEAVNRWDLEAVMSFFAADAVWDMSPIDMGIFERGVAILVVDGLVERLTSYTEIDEARAAAERLAEQRG
jgi:hypothetical protein